MNTEPKEFLELFPSLKGKLYIKWYEDIQKCEEEGDLVYIQSIADNCLDKQRVREALKKLWCEYEELSESPVTYGVLQDVASRLKLGDLDE